MPLHHAAQGAAQSARFLTELRYKCVMLCTGADFLYCLRQKRPGQ